MYDPRHPYSSLPGIPHIPTMKPTNYTTYQPSNAAFSNSASSANMRHTPSHNQPHSQPHTTAASNSSLVYPTKTGARSFTPHPQQFNPPEPSPPSQAIVPYQAPETSITPVEPASKKSGGFNMGDLKGFVDRMGGIDGIVSTMTKVQKVMQSVQQFAPVAKMLMGTFMGGKAKANSDGEEEMFFTPTKKRRKRQPNSNGRRQQQKRPAAKQSPPRKNTQRQRKKTAKSSNQQSASNGKSSPFFL